MLRLWRIGTILLVSLSMSMAFSHALELIPKMGYGAPLYLTLQRTLYVLFGAPLGATIEVAAVIASVILMFLVRGRKPAFSLTLVAAICMATAHAIWWIWVDPANVTMAHMPIQNPPPDWTGWSMRMLLASCSSLSAS